MLEKAEVFTAKLTIIWNSNYENDTFHYCFISGQNLSLVLLTKRIQ